MCAPRAVVLLRFLAAESRLVATQLRCMVCCLLSVPFESAIGGACLALACTRVIHKDLADRSYFTSKLRQVDCTILIMTVLFLCLFLRRASQRPVLHRLLSLVIVVYYRSRCVEVVLRLINACRQGTYWLLNTFLARLSIHHQSHTCLDACVGLVNFLS